MFDFSGPLYGLIGAAVLGVVGTGVVGTWLPWYGAIPLGGGGGATLGYFIGYWIGERS